PGAGAGFAAALSASSLPAGYLEFIVINHNTMGWGAAFDVGVSNSNGTGSGYEIVQVNNRELGFGIPSTVGYAADQMLHLFEFPVTAENVGPVSLTVDVDPAAGPLEIAWLPRSFQTGGIAGAAAWAATDPTGRARLDVNIAEAGYYALVVYRHPDWSDGNPPLEVTVKVARTPPDFLPPLLPGWHAPIVPRPAFDGRPDWVPAPTTLPGNVSSTVLNLAVRNNSPVLVEAALYGAVHLDGVWWRVRPWWGFAAASTETEHFLGPLSVRGGRHTLSWKLDPDNLIEEISETNNDWTEQWVWTPLALSPADAPIVRDLPPAMWGGWTELSTGEPFYPNCDGLRLPNTGSYWRAVAVMPGAGRDVALQLHEASSGAKHGFEISLALSWWGGDASEYVLVNLNRAPNLDYDVGVLGSGEAGQYTAHMAQTSGYLAFPDGSYGPYGLPPDRILDLHEVYLPGGPTGIHLMNAAGDVDWGLSLHPAQGAFQGKADALGAAWLAGAGANELLVVDVPEPGFYCIAVWKTDANQLAKDGAYSLLIRPMWASDAEDDVPALATRLVDIAPNPFNPQTRITYELAQPGRVQLEVYDLQGRRVRTLVDLEQGAGRHDEVWNGLDDAGGRAASGLYMARLTAAGVTRMMKMTLVK
ncbi:T9SS type A sorting domain-containing protein, partial [bacterium]|nr:T9SS type A sorting domain-containing protein [bacterium]